MDSYGKATANLQEIARAGSAREVALTGDRGFVSLQTATTTDGSGGSESRTGHSALQVHAGQQAPPAVAGEATSVQHSNATQLRRRTNNARLPKPASNNVLGSGTARIHTSPATL